MQFNGINDSFESSSLESSFVSENSGMDSYISYSPISNKKKSKSKSLNDSFDSFSTSKSLSMPNNLLDPLPPPNIVRNIKEIRIRVNPISIMGLPDGFEYNIFIGLRLTFVEEPWSIKSENYISFSPPISVNSGEEYLLKQNGEFIIINTDPDTFNKNPKLMFSLELRHSNDGERVSPSICLGVAAISCDSKSSDKYYPVITTISDDDGDLDLDIEDKYVQVGDVRLSINLETVQEFKNSEKNIKILENGKFANDPGDDNPVIASWMGKPLKRTDPEYLVAWELECWRRSEENRLRGSLERQVSAKLVKAKNDHSKELLNARKSLSDLEEKLKNSLEKVERYDNTLKLREKHLEQLERKMEIEIKNREKEKIAYKELEDRYNELQRKFLQSDKGKNENILIKKVEKMRKREKALKKRIVGLEFELGGMKSIPRDNSNLKHSLSSNTKPFIGKPSNSYLIRNNNPYLGKIPKIKDKGDSLREKLLKTNLFSADDPIIKSLSS